MQLGSCMGIGQRWLRNRMRIPSDFDIPYSKFDIDFDTAVTNKAH